MTLYEVTFSVGNSSETSYLTTMVSAHHQSQAEALVEAQYGSACVVHSCYPKGSA
jgi:hypothetical protein